MWKKIPDSFLLGMISGLASLSLFYIGLANLRLLIVNYYQDPYLLMAPKVQLFSIFLNVVFFRISMVNLGKEKFAKGILMVTVLLTFVYFFYYLKYHQSLTG